MESQKAICKIADIILNELLEGLLGIEIVRNFNTPRLKEES